MAGIIWHQARWQLDGMKDPRMVRFLRRYDRGDASRKLPERASIVVDKASLQTGVNIFTLFTEEGKVLAQREVFVNNHDMDGLRLQVSMPEEGTALKPYEKVTLDCQIVDADGNPVKERNKLSMAITDGLYRDGTYADGNVLSYLLLGSEVKGFIPHPEYYFESDDREHRVALDLLMMVQGWTR